MVKSLLSAVALVSLAGFGLSAGDRAFRDGRYDEAVEQYRRALQRNDKPELRYNLGTALLMQGRFDEARSELERAARADQPRVSQPALYNSGNADLEPAFRAQASPERTAALSRSIVHYRQALLLDPTDADAKWNLELAQQLLEEAAIGGGEGAPDQGGEGVADDDQDAPTQPDPTPSTEGGGTQPRMTPTEAKDLLLRATDREQELQQQKLQRAPGSPRNVRDW